MSRWTVWLVERETGRRVCWDGSKIDIDDHVYGDDVHYVPGKIDGEFVNTDWHELSRDCHCFPVVGETVNGKTEVTHREAN